MLHTLARTFLTLRFLMVLALGMPTWALAANPGVIEITNPDKFETVFAISDVHGMYKPLISLLKAAHVIDSNLHWNAGHALFIVIGDSIDKGPNSLEVMNLWVHLTDEAKAAGGRLIHTLGNHEAEFLSDPTDDEKADVLFAELKSKGMNPSQWADPTKDSGKFLHSMPLALRVGNWLFAHSGFYPDMSWSDFSAKAQKNLEAGNYSSDFIIGNASILEMKKWELDPELRKQVLGSLDKNGIQGVVFGHQPAALGILGWSGISRDHRLIKVDNGMAPQAGAHAGTLLVFEVPSELAGDKPLHLHVITPAGASDAVRVETATSATE